MSRSYRKVPGFTYRNKFFKNQANRKVRHYNKGLDSGGSYKKLYESYLLGECFGVYFNELQVSDSLYNINRWVLGNEYPHERTFWNISKNPEKYLMHRYQYFQK